MIPKRAISALVTTVFALVLLLSFKTPESPGLASSTSSDTAIVGAPTTTQAPTATSGTSGTATDAGTTGTTEATAAPTAAPTQDTTTTSGYADGTVTGDVVSTRFGDIQVQVTISGGAIADVTALELPSGDRHSSQISNAVEPMLREAALSAQSANIDLVSGATYTSRAYAQSLQSALDQAQG